MKIPFWSAFVQPLEFEKSGLVELATHSVARPRVVEISSGGAGFEAGQVCVCVCVCVWVCVCV
jgi:hypothetical protein